MARLGGDGGLGVECPGHLLQDKGVTVAHPRPAAHPRPGFDPVPGPSPPPPRPLSDDPHREEAFCHARDEQGMSRQVHVLLPPLRQEPPVPEHGQRHGGGAGARGALQGGGDIDPGRRLHAGPEPGRGILRPRVRERPPFRLASRERDARGPHRRRAAENDEAGGPATRSPSASSPGTTRSSGKSARRSPRRRSNGPSPRRRGRGWRRSASS